MSGLQRGGSAPLRRAEFTALPGELTALYGADGTAHALLAAVVGHDPVDAGSARLGEIELASAVPRRAPHGDVAVLHAEPTHEGGLTVAACLDRAVQSAGPSTFELFHSLQLGDVRDRRIDSLDSELQQRVALGYALASGRRIIAGFGPFARLGSRAARMLEGILRVAAHERDLVVVLATSDPVAAARAQHTVIVGRGGVLADRRGVTESELVSRIA